MSDFPGRPLLPLAKDDLTVATVLKRAGYHTGGFGKWGLGNPATTGTPDQHGFDEFFGYLDQVHAHDYYTDHLVRNGGEEVPLKEGTYSHDAIHAEAMQFVRKHKDEPFFLYLPYTPPHAKYVVPTTKWYADKPWSQQDKNYASMITYLDEDVGELMTLLKELKLDEKTVVFYTSDNGPNAPFLKTFASNKPFRGIKRQSYEGGIRCPMIVRWPEKITAGAESDFAWTHKDFFATACQLAGVKTPGGLDSVSVLPTLLGKAQEPQPHLYWEMHSPFHQAVRMGHWKGVRWGTQEPVELYNLKNDIAEATDVAKQHPEVVQQIATIMTAERSENKYWPSVEKRAKKGTKRPGAATKASYRSNMTGSLPVGR
jgi:arylsulfatase A-like enzyme